MIFLLRTSVSELTSIENKKFYTNQHPTAKNYLVGCNVIHQNSGSNCIGTPKKAVTKQE